MNALHEKVDAALEAGDRDRVVRLLAATPEGEIGGLFRRLRKRIGESHRDGDRQAARALTALAVVITAPGASSAVNRIVELRPGPGLCEAVATGLAGRGPVWLPAMVEMLMAQERTPHWPLVRALVRVKAVERPDTPDYILRMARGGLGGDIRAALLADPELLHGEVFALFTVEGAAHALRTHDSSRARAGGTAGSAAGDGSWRVALARLAGEGHIDRARLLDACLGAFLRDFPPHQVGWYAGLHAELAPTADETAARAGTYQRLLAADAGAAVGIAQSVLQTLLTAGRLGVAELVECAEPPLHRREKKYVSAQLRLLGRIARLHPEVAPRAAAVAAVALGHERTDLQESALALVREHARDPGALLREHMGQMAPAPRA